MNAGKGRIADGFLLQPRIEACNPGIFIYCHRVESGKIVHKHGDLAVVRTVVAIDLLIVNGMVYVAVGDQDRFVTEMGEGAAQAAAGA
jgi:hypothetical protein